MKKNWGRSAQELKMSSVRKPGKKLMSPGFSNPKMIQLMHILPMKYPMLDPIHDCKQTWNGCNYVYEWPFLECSTYLSEIGRNLKTNRRLYKKWRFVCRFGGQSFGSLFCWLVTGTNNQSAFDLVHHWVFHFRSTTLDS